MKDFTKVESAKHLLQLSVECCLDIANHIIASEGFRAPKSYVDSFAILVEQGILPGSLFPRLRRMAQFRNRLVHLYWEVKGEVVYEILQNDLSDFDDFARHILNYLAAKKG